MSARLLTVAEAAKVLRGEDTPAARALVRTFIIEGRLSAIKQGNRWFVQAASIDALVTPVTKTGGVFNPPRVVQTRASRVV